MKILKNKAVHIHYTLKNDQGETMDSSVGQDPLAYIHGHGNLIPGLEKALENKGKGEKIKASIAPEEAYGVKNKDLVQNIPLSNFQDQNSVKVGRQFQINTEQGPVIATIINVKEGQVTIDMNHQLAGQTLHFDVEVMEVRDATQEELAHGHIHGAGGHHH